jgi:nucleotide-binding universal stress UspA family protein
MFKRLALAVAFSPRLEAMMCETKRFAKLFDAELLFIHVGERSDEIETKLTQIIQNNGFDLSKTKIIWELGDPGKKLIETCKRENVDLLVTGALKRESFFRYHFSSVARKIMRKAETSLMVLLEPSQNPSPFKCIVINGTDHPHTSEIIKKGIELAIIENAKSVHIVNEVQLMGLRMSMAGEDSATQVEDLRRNLVKEEVQKIEDILSDIDKGGLKVNIKIVSGKPGYEMARFAEKMHADLLVLRAPDHKLNILDRFFPHDLEFILNDLPSNLLIIQHKRA